MLLQQPTPSSQQKQGQEEGGEGGKGGQKKKKKNSATAAAAAAAASNNNKLVPIKEDVAPSTTSRSTTPLVVPLNSPLSPRKASQVGQSFFAQDAWSDSASSDSEYQVI
jgi:ribosome assembly protein YihI (activator of Der GTPase)